MEKFGWTARRECCLDFSAAAEHFRAHFQEFRVKGIRRSINHIFYLKFKALGELANDCGILMVEIEAKEAVISQTLQSSQEAIHGYDIQNLPEMDQSAQ